MTEILYIGTHPEILQTVLRLINTNPERTGFGAANEKEAAAILSTHDIKLVLLGCGLDENVERRLTEWIRKHNPDLPIVQHYGGGSGLLESEIRAAL